MVVVEVCENQACKMVWMRLTGIGCPACGTNTRLADIHNEKTWRAAMSRQAVGIKVAISRPEDSSSAPG